MNWLTYQLSQTRCLIAHLFKRPDLARLNILQGELYRLRIRNAERSGDLRQAEARVKYLEDTLESTIHNNLSGQCQQAHIAHRNAP